MKLLFVVVGVALLFVAAANANEEEFEEDNTDTKPVSSSTLTYILQHNIDGEWTTRGEISIPKTGKPTITQKASESDLNAIYELAKGTDVYRLRLFPKNDESNPVSTYTSACAFFSSDLQDAISLHVDADNRVYGIDVTHSFSCKSGAVPKKKSKNFHSHIALQQPRVGPKPFLDDLQAELERKQLEASGAVQPEKSFIQKYWMYILPVVVMMLLRSPEAPAAGAGAAGGAPAASS